MRLLSCNSSLRIAVNVILATMLAGRMGAALAIVEADFEHTPTVEAWDRLAEYLERNALWNAAAHARLRGISAESLLRRNSASRRLLLLHDRLRADDLAGAADSMHSLSRDSRAANWLLIEWALARNRPDLADQPLTQLRARAPTAEDDAAAGLLYCGESLKSRLIDEYLRARVAFARGDLEAAMILPEAMFPDVDVLRANVLDAMGRSDDALAVLERLRSARLQMQIPSTCPGVLIDRVLYNEANIAARSDPRRAIGLYRDAIAAAEQRESELGAKLAEIHAPSESPLMPILYAATHGRTPAAPDAHNNLGQLLLRFALRKKGLIEELESAKEEFTLAIENGEYRTKQYSYLGLARVELARGRETAALDWLSRALALDPRNGPALDFAESLAATASSDVSAQAALLLLYFGKRSLPAAYLNSEYAWAFEQVADATRTVDSEPAHAFRASYALWRHDADAAKQIETALLRYPRSIWPEALRLEQETASGSIEQARVVFASLAQRTAPRNWESPIVLEAASRYGRSALLANDHSEADRADILLATLDRKSVV